MRTFMVTLFECSAVMSVLALVYMLVNRLLLKRFPEKWRYYTWLIIIVGLIIPFRPQFGNDAVKVDASDILTMPVILSSELVGDSVKNAEETIAETDENFNVSALVLNILSNKSWWDIAAIAWLFGTVIFLVCQMIKHRRFMKAAKRWSESVDNEQILSLHKDLKTEMKIAGELDLQICEFVSSPMLVGFIKPRILLPETEFAQSELRFILKHELIHYTRKDILYRFLTMIATAMHWFNPVVHIVAKSVYISCELSCDEEVVKGEDFETRRYYSNTILGVVKYQTKLKTLLSTHFNGGKTAVKKRLSSIMDIGRKRGGVIIACVVVISVLGTGSIFAINTSGQREREWEIIEMQMNAKLSAAANVDAPEDGDYDNSISGFYVYNSDGQYVLDNDPHGLYMRDIVGRLRKVEPAHIKVMTYEEYDAWLEETKIRVAAETSKSDAEMRLAWALINGWESERKQIKNGTIKFKQIIIDGVVYATGDFYLDCEQQ